MLYIIFSIYTNYFLFVLLREDFIFYTNNNKYVWNNELFHYIFNLYKLFSFYVISQTFNFIDRLYR